MLQELSFFRARNEEVIRVSRLTRELAVAHAARLLQLHNQIPFQHWTVEHLLASGDSTRQFLRKWEISRIAWNETSEPIGFCIGFERPAELGLYPTAGFYMHRMAVDPVYRSQYLGALLQAEASELCFACGLAGAGDGDEVVLYGQTNDVPENAPMLGFYRDAGFEIIGHKRYPDRTDVVMRMTRESFNASRHAALRLARRLPHGGVASHEADSV